MNLNHICEHTRIIAKEAGRFMAAEQSKISASSIQVKGINDFVTYVDKASEKMIVERLSELLPEAGFITEEGTATNKGEHFNWIIDPLDGTTNFIHNVFPYSVSIALMEDSEIIMGVVYEVSRNECFYSYKGAPAMMDKTEIHCSLTSKLSESLLGTGFPYNDYSLLEKFMELTNYMVKNSHGIRRPGSAATDLVYVACGRFDGFYEYSLKPWDVAAGAFILQQAGGKVADFSGGTDYLFGGEMVAANSLVFDELMSVVKKIMK